MIRPLMLLAIFLHQLLLAAPSLEMFDRFSKKEGGPDTRGAIWYDERHNNIFVADHGKGLWKIDECGNDYGQTTDKDKGLWDISYDKHYIFAIGESGLFIYDEAGNMLSTLGGLQGEGIYVNNGYAYIVNKKDGIAIVNVKDIMQPRVVTTAMKGEKFSQIRGKEIQMHIANSASGEPEEEYSIQLLYVTSLDGKLYLLEADGSQLDYRDSVSLFSSSEARKIFVGKSDLVYVNSNYGELAIVKLQKEHLKLTPKGYWKSSEDHGAGQQAPAAGGVFVTEVKDGKEKKKYALITAANGNSDGYLYWLDVTDPSDIKHIDTLHDSAENYGFNDIWVNDTRIYLAAHNGFTFMGMKEARIRPTVSIQDKDGIYREDIIVTQNAADLNDTKTFSVKVANSSSTKPLDVRVTAPKAAHGWQYQYFYHNEDVTNQITSDNGYKIKNIAPSSSKILQMEMTPVSENAQDATATVSVRNSESRFVCNKAPESNDVTAKVTFQGEGQKKSFECSASFPGAVSSTNDEIQINDGTKIYGTTNHTLITKQLSAKSSVQCDNAPCRASDTLAKKIDFSLLLGSGKDGDKILSDNKSLTISSDKEYKKFQTGQHNTIHIKGDITIKSQSDFYMNADTEIYINGNVVIYADKFDANQQGIFHINGSLTIFTNVFYLNSGNKLQDIEKPQDFVVLAKEIIDINSQVDFKGIFYSDGDIQINNDTRLTGALTGNYIDINDHSMINYDAGGVSDLCAEKDEPTPLHSSNGECFAMPDNEAKLYVMQMQPGGDPLPTPTTVNLSRSFNGEGAAYRATDGKIYAFAGSGPASSSNGDSKKKKKKKKSKKGKGKYESLNDGASGDLYTIDPATGDISPVKMGLIPGQEVEAAEFYYDPVTKRDTLYVITSEVSPKLHAFDPESWQELPGYPKNIVGNDGESVILAGLAIDPNSAIAYATDDYDYDDEYSQLYTLDLHTGIATWKSEIQGVLDAEGLAFADDGHLYVEDEGYDSDDKRFYALDPENGNFVAAANYPADFSDDSDIEAISCNGGESTVTESQKPSRFNVWDRDESINHQVIKTKIVDRPIPLTFASLNKDGNAFEATNATDIEVALFSTDRALTRWHPVALEAGSTHLETIFTIDDFIPMGTAHQAFPAVKAFIRYKDTAGEQHIVTSSDTFAIRPARYSLSLAHPSEKLVAGKAFEMLVKAETEDGRLIDNYNASKEGYDISYEEVKESGVCRTGNLTMAKGDFVNGIAHVTATYDEVGQLVMRAFERKYRGTEFSRIDSDDTPERYIHTASFTTTPFDVGDIAVVNMSLVSGAGRYTYYSSDPIAMGAKLSVDVMLQPKNMHAALQNFKNACYAKTMDVTVHFIRDKADERMQPVGAYQDGTALTIDTMTIGQSEGSFRFQIPKERFNDGVGLQSVLLNFQREADRARNPLFYTVTKVNASVGDITVQEDLNQSIAYLYTRAHAPDQEATGTTMDVRIFYEAYCNGVPLSRYGLDHYPESVDSIHWYILPESETSQLDFDAVHAPDTPPHAAGGSVTAIDSVFQTLARKDNGHIHAVVKKAPTKSALYFHPLPYLLYNLYDSTATEEKCLVTFNPKPREWAGRGKRGGVVDTDVSPRNAFEKIDW